MPKLSKLPKLPKMKMPKMGMPNVKMPKFVTANKPSGANMKQIMMVMVIILVAFTFFYAVRMLGMQTWIAPPLEKFSEQEQPAFKVILIYSDSCPHCRTFKPTFDEVASQSSTMLPQVQVTFIKIDATTEQAAKYAQYASNGIPATLIEKNGTVDANLSMVGNMDKSVFVDRLKAALV